MKDKYQPGQQVYFLICGHHAAESIIRLPHNRIFVTEEEARKHIRPKLPPKQPVIREENGKYVCTRRWDLCE